MSVEKGLHLHFDPCSGVAGDMTVAALVDAGVPAKVVTAAVKAVGVKGLKVGFERRKRGAFVGLGFTVDWPGKAKEAGHDHDSPSGTSGHGPYPSHHPLASLAPSHDHDHDHGKSHDHDHGHDSPSGTSGHGPYPSHHPLAPSHDHDHDHVHEHRDYAEIRRLLRKAKLDAETKRLAGEIFARIAREEAALHGTEVERVAFHEVGAWDSIADIVGAAAALAWLEPSGVTSGAPVVGTGVVHTAHGLMPVPAPATAAILRGLPMLAEGRGELTTPTGAAILATVVRDFGAPPPMQLVAQGFGAGTREHADRPNVLRVLLGRSVGQAAAASPTDVLLVAANIDDMSPQLVDPLMAALFEAGAVDVWLAPVTMKKGRPAVEVSALCAPDALAAVEDAFFVHSTTIGVRRQPCQRTVLERAFVPVATPYGQIRAKVVSRQGRIAGATPEFEDCRKLAVRAGVPVRAVLAEAHAATLRWLAGKGKRR